VNFSKRLFDPATEVRAHPIPQPSLPSLLLRSRETFSRR